MIRSTAGAGATGRSSGRGILWDFDGTLAIRPGLWKATLMEILDEHEPGHDVRLEQVRSGLQNGFPWHRPQEAHPHLNDPEAWWRSVNGLVARAYEGAGVPPARAAELAVLVRERYVDPSRGWRLVEGAREALDRLAAAGWRHAILSNHVPELPRIVDGLGIRDRFVAVLTSASMGYEKPHPRTFELGRLALGDPQDVWMVGDNPEADVAGAEAVGIKGLLVQHPDRPPQTGAVQLAEVPGLIQR
jgi:putative hydrolase of the HAD superfamily